MLIGPCSLVPPVASAARYGASYFPASIRDAMGRKIDEYAGPGNGSTFLFAMPTA
jgi:hypothetical protein